MHGLKFYENLQKDLQTEGEMIIIKDVISTNHVRVLTNPLQQNHLNQRRQFSHDQTVG
ncbi:MAG: hypothetical protein K0Q94_3172 [Paenibacillus sp.]|jgi:hypothetical protein|nr:hypothetical protein [Paenibacillus sp.]